MEWINLFYDFMKVCVLPMLGVLTVYLVNYIKAQGAKLQADAQNELASKYIGMLTETIAECVVATNQTYVDSLKAQNKFNREAQQHAFNMTYEAVMSILSDEAKLYLSEVYGDLNLYLTKKIEAEVNANKI